MALSAYFISIDLGTQGTKVAVVDGEGDLIGSILKSTRLQRFPGCVVEQEPNHLLDSVIEGIRDVIELTGVDRHRVEAIGISGQMAGILGINQAGEAMTPYDSWLDSRCSAYFETMRTYEEEVIAITGCPVTYAHGPKILWWKHERPETYSRVRKFVPLTTFIALRLTGGDAADAYIDYTHLHFTGLAHVQQRVWSDTLLHAFDVDEEKLPKIVEPWRVIGRLTSRYAAICGLPSGISIVAGAGDTAATALGSGVTRAGIVLDVAGTASVLSCCVDRYEPDQENKTLIYAPSVLPGLWNPLAYINGGGQCLEWFRGQFSMEHRELSFEELNRGAAGIAPGSDGLLFVPHYGGRSCPNNPRLTGAWWGLNWSHDRYAMYRSIMESIAYEYRIYLDILRPAVGELTLSEVRVVGGGSKGSLFNRIKSDVLGIPYTTIRGSEPAHLANAAIAGYGVGAFADLAVTSAEWAETDQRHAPNERNAPIYRQAVSNYTTLLDHLARVELPDLRQ